MNKIFVTEENVKAMGRITFYEGICYLGYSASEIGFFYTGNRILAEIVTSEEYRVQEQFQGWIGVIAGEDAEPWKRLPLEAAKAEYLLFDREEYAREKRMAAEELPKELSIRIIKYSEAAFGITGICSLQVDEGAMLRPLPKKERRIEFIGDSMTCGYGVEGVWNVDVFNTPQENPMKAYAVRTAQELNADYQLVSWSGIGLLTDWIPAERDEPDTTILMPELYPYTDTSLSRRMNVPLEPWDVSKFQPDAVVIHLGTNDASYTKQIPEREQIFADAYRSLYQKIRCNYGMVDIVCCLGIMDRTLCPVIECLVQELRTAGDANIHYLEFDGQLESDGIASDWHPSQITHEKAAKKLATLIGSLWSSR